MREDLDRLEAANRDLDALDAALRRLDDGTYGTCEVCGAALGDDRVATSPLARRCRDHEDGPASNWAQGTAGGEPARSPFLPF